MSTDRDLAARKPPAEDNRIPSRRTRHSDMVQLMAGIIADSEITLRDKQDRASVVTMIASILDELDAYEKGELNP